MSPLRSDAGWRVIAAVRDITARVAVETEAAQVRTVLDVTNDAVLMFEQDTLRFTYVNQGAIAQLGYSRDELLSMGPLHIKPMFSESEFRALIATVSAGQSHSYMTVHRRKDGSDIPQDVVLRVEDDGIGLPVDARHGGGNGLANMAARAAKLGGACEITAASPSGTVLEWRVPRS